MLFNDGPQYNMLMAILAFAAVVTTIVTIYFAKKSLRPPKRSLQVQVTAISSLMTDHARSIGLEISYAGQEIIEDPYFLEITVENVGRHSITTSSFDQGRPIIVAVKSSPAVLGGATDNRIRLGLATGDWFEIKIMPELYKPGMKFSYKLITRGRPQLALKEEHLIDGSVDLVHPYSEKDNFTPAKIWITTGALTIAVINTLAAIVLAVTLLFNRSPLEQENFRSLQFPTQHQRHCFDAQRREQRGRYGGY